MTAERTGSVQLPFGLPPGCSVGGVPVASEANIDDQGNGEFRSFGHRSSHLVGEGLGEGLAHLKDELIVNLEDHGRALAIEQRIAGDGDHCTLDDVGSAPLHRRVDRRSLRRLPALRLAGLEVGKIQAPTEKGLDIAPLVRAPAGFFHVSAHAGITLEVAFDVALGLLAGDRKLARKAEGAHPVNEAKVDRFGGAALLWADLAERHAEDFSGGGAVHVLALAEGGEQALIAREVGHDPQFDLRIIRREQQIAWGRDEGAADAAALLGAHRDVLKVRIRAREPARARDRLVELGVDATGVRIDELDQAVGVGALELGELPVFEHDARKLMVLGEL